MLIIKIITRGYSHNAYIIRIVRTKFATGDPPFYNIVDFSIIRTQPKLGITVGFGFSPNLLTF